MTSKVATIFFSLFMLLHAGSTAQSFLRASGKAIVNETGDTVYLKGMGLGGWMLQEGYMLQTAGFANAQYQIRQKIEALLGQADTDAFYEAWLANHVRKIDIDSLKAWGFNCVRLPMHYQLFTLPVEEEPVAGQHTWLDKGFELTDSLISWCRQNQMYVILDLHAAPGGQGMDQGISDYDPTKPSLWESQANRDKTVALWVKLARRYAGEPVVAGYDLINEPNWQMTGNTPLRDLYYRLTDSIRAVDQRHILFIEGNWFANDFTGLTPPWDDNLVYSPHKYWSTNDQASIQWVLDLRERYNVPLFFGECGENSNTWFRDAIRLFEQHQIGWAWWPMKKVESISGPLSVKKNAGYQALLDYWSGNGSPPTAVTAKAALMQLAEDLKLERCVYQKDVIDAMFRQVQSDEAVPYTTHPIPGTVYVADFDMGPVGVAYFDTEVANYHVSTGTYTAWNNGWVYRNDGVDLETSEDNLNPRGVHAGWLSPGEWMQYSVEVASSAVYDVEVRVASTGTDGRFHFSAGGADISTQVAVPNTGGWQNWQSLLVRDVILSPADTKVRFHVDAPGFNVGNFKFIQKAETQSLPTTFLSAFTLDEQHIQLNLNKALMGPLPAAPAGFSLRVDGQQIAIVSLSLNEQNPRIITFGLNHNFRAGQVITLSYSGTQLSAQDGTLLRGFSQQPVQNTISVIHSIPGRIEAEDYFFQSGIVLEATSDAGGGQNVGYLDAGDYLDYRAVVERSGTYTVDYRTAAQSETGQVQMQLVDPDGGVTVLHQVSFPPTGGWQNWATTQATLSLPAGEQHLRLLITQPLFNINWFEFNFLVGVDKPQWLEEVKVFPNPGRGQYRLQLWQNRPQKLHIEVWNLLGQRLWQQLMPPQQEQDTSIDLRALPAGQYVLKITSEAGDFYSSRLLKVE